MSQSGIIFFPFGFGFLDPFLYIWIVIIDLGQIFQIRCCLDPLTLGKVAITS